MKIAYNYSKMKNRDKKLYSIQGQKISSTGLSYKYLQVLSVTMVAFNFVGAFICVVAGRFYYWPFDEHMNINLAFPMIFIGLPFGVTMLLLYAKVQKYSLLEFLTAYLSPKRTRDQQGKILRYSQYKQDTFIERIF